MVSFECIATHESQKLGPVDQTSDGFHTWPVHVQDTVHCRDLDDFSDSQYGANAERTNEIANMSFFYRLDSTQYYHYEPV